MTTKKKVTKKKTSARASLTQHRYLAARVTGLSVRLATLTQSVQAIDDKAAGKDWVRDVSRRAILLERTVESIDQKTDPARGTVARRLELLEATLEVVSQRTAKQGRDHREFLEELSAVRVQQRALVLTLGEWAPGDANTVNSLQFLLEHTPELTPAAGADDDAGTG